MKRSWCTVFATAALVALAVGAAGCLISYDADSANVDEFVPGDTSPRIIVVSPAPEQSVSGELPVQLSLRNFSLVAPAGQENNAGEGHLRVYIDEACLEDEASPGPGASDFCPSPRPITQATFNVDVSGLEAGTHRFQLEVRNNDGTRSAVIEPVLIDFVKP